MFQRKFGEIEEKMEQVVRIIMKLVVATASFLKKCLLDTLCSYAQPKNPSVLMIIGTKIKHVMTKRKRGNHFTKLNDNNL